MRRQRSRPGGSTTTRSGRTAHSTALRRTTLPRPRSGLAGWRRLASMKSRLEASAHGFPPDTRRPLDPQKRPPQSAERTDLLLFVVIQGVAHADEGLHVHRPRQRPGRRPLIAVLGVHRGERTTHLPWQQRWARELTRVLSRGTLFLDHRSHHAGQAGARPVR